MQIIFLVFFYTVVLYPPELAPIFSKRARALKQRPSPVLAAHMESANLVFDSKSSFQFNPKREASSGFRINRSRIEDMGYPKTNKALRFSSIGGPLELIEKEVPPLPAHAACESACSIH
jgi:hypothetical protein